MLSINEICLARDDSGKYRECKIIAVNKRSARVVIDGLKMTLPFCSLQKKKKPVKHPRFAKQADNKLLTKRLGRHRKISVVPTYFSVGRILGDFGQMIRSPSYKDDGLFLFNDNHMQWNFAINQPMTHQDSGGGNACIRPYESKGHAIGIPTGPYTSLQEVWDFDMGDGGYTKKSAKQIIDIAFDRIVTHCIYNPDKTTLFYSADFTHSDPESIGLGIFANRVGSDVVAYITHKLKELPEVFRRVRVSGDMHRDLVPLQVLPEDPLLVIHSPSL